MSDSPRHTGAEAPDASADAAAASSTDEADAGLFRRGGGGAGAKKKLTPPDDDERRAGGGSGPRQEQLSRGQGDPALEYSMRHAKRGHCLILNQVRFYPETGQSERAGSDVDADSLEQTFRRLRFDVIPFRDLTCAKIVHVVRELAAKDHSECDCVVIAILSHGENGCVYGADGKLHLEKLTRMLRADNCPSLAGKPKLFFVQACRGSDFDKGHTVVEEADGGKEDKQGTGKLSRIPLESDFLYFYSTPPGYYSWRNDIDGSWFVQQLCRVLNEHGDQVELGQLLLTVQRLVASEFQSRSGDPRSSGMKQIPVTVSTLRKLLYFRRK